MLECPRLARGIVTLPATYRYTQRPLATPACPVDTYVLSYCSEERNDPPGKPVAFKAASVPSGVARSNDPPGKPVAFK